MKSFVAILGVIALVPFVMLPGCGDDNGNKFQLSNLGEIELDPQQMSYGVEIGQVVVGEALDYTIRIVNVGTADLTISDIQLDYDTPESEDSHGPAFSLQAGGIDGDLVIAPLGDEGESLGVADHTLLVRFTRQEAFLDRTASLTITSDSRSNGVLTVQFAEQNATAVAQVSPAVLDYGVVPIGTVGERFIQVVNTGATDLIVDGFTLSGHADFAVNMGEDSWGSSEETLFKIAFPEPIVVKEGGVTQVRVTFEPNTPDSAAGEVVLYANDTKGKHPVTLWANQNVPCVKVTPSMVDFGGKLVGTKSEFPVKVESCGAASLKIYGASLYDPKCNDECVEKDCISTNEEEKQACEDKCKLDCKEGSNDFTLRFYDIIGVDPDTGINPQAPLVLDVNESIELTLEFVPDIINPMDAENKPIPDTGVLFLKTNAIEGTIEVDISGSGVDVQCPIAIATVNEGEEVIPQTTLHLKGDQSYSPAGLNIKNWLWSSTQPEGSTTIFIPSPTFNNPVFEVNVAGYYEFTLVVTDSANIESCEPAIIPVVVVPDEAIHVELLWSTENDTNLEDEGEGNGTDLDLHFAHPFSNGPDIDGVLAFPGGALTNPTTMGDPWFDTKFDCFWYNKEPNWGTFNPEYNDNPSLDRDDIDGWGPENLNINIPEENATYRVGVHYWNDHGFGESLATVRVFVYGVLETEVKDVPLTNHDMWFALEIPWVAGATQTKVLKDEGDAYLITPNYQNPMFLSQ